MHTVGFPAEVAGTVEFHQGDENMPLNRKPVIEIPKDSVGSVIKILLVDEAGAAEDVSGGTSVLFYARTLDGTAVVAGDSGAYTTDGSDGYVQFVATSALVGEERDLYCEFEITGLAAGGPSELFILRVNPRAKVSA